MNPFANKPRVAFIDTTELFQRYLLHTRDWEELLDRCERGQVKLLFSEVVLQEAERQYTGMLDKLLAEEAKHTRELRTHGFKITERDVAGQREDLANNYRASLAAKIAAAGGEVLPLPKAGHQDLLDRAKLRRKPFNSNGKGYQDALVWQSIIEYLQEHADDLPQDAASLVTGNTADYCEKSGDLAHELQDEIRSIDENLTLKCVPSVRDLIEDLREEFKDADRAHRQRLLQLSATPNGAEEELDDEAAELDRRITEAVEGAAERMLGQPVRSSDADEGRGSTLIVDYALPDELDEATIEDVEILPNSVDYEVQEHYAGDTMAVSATVEATVRLEGFLAKADYYLIDDDSIEVYDDDWNDHYMWVGVLRTMKLSFNLLTVGQTVESTQFEGAEIV